MSDKSNSQIIHIKPMSVNEAYKGPKRKTERYEDYEEAVYCMIRDYPIAETGKLKLVIKWGLSSKVADCDNPIKPFQDILQKKFEFNDKRIYKLDVEKFDVKKGKEFIEFELLPFIQKERVF